jgi:hypothetical protein
MSRVERSHTWRVALFFLAVASIFWLGGINGRAFVGNDMLKPGTLEFEEYLSPEVEREVYRLMAIMSMVIIVSYLVTLTSSIIFFISSPLRFKDHGWLLMSAILFYVFVPVEAFTSYLDAKMIYMEFFTTADNLTFRELFSARVNALAGVPTIALLCYYTIIALVVFQPFKKKVHTSA